MCYILENEGRVVDVAFKNLYFFLGLWGVMDGFWVVEGLDSNFGLERFFRLLWGGEIRSKRIGEEVGGRI